MAHARNVYKWYATLKPPVDMPDPFRRTANSARVLSSRLVWWRRRLTWFLAARQPPVQNTSLLQFSVCWQMWASSNQRFHSTALSLARMTPLYSWRPPTFAVTRNFAESHQPERFPGHAVQQNRVQRNDDTTMLLSCCLFFYYFWSIIL